jgi:hypothetical protein
MDWLYTKYVGLLSTRLDNFKRKGNTWNFRCPICGDSQTDKSKTRGYIYEYKGNLKYHCHNCGADMGVEQFIKEIDPGLASELALEKIREGRVGVAKFIDQVPKKFEYQQAIDSLKTIDKLPLSHVCRQFVAGRKIPELFYKRLYYAPVFKNWVNEIIPEKFKGTNDEARLVIPFVTDGKMHALQGRTIDPESTAQKYIMIVTDESVPSLYGLDRANLNKRTYVLEGPIDSMFLPNAIAAGGGDFHTRLNGIDNRNLVLVYDNEPRSRDTVKRMQKAIRAGFAVCVWPDRIEEKDINNMILAGHTAEYIQYVIDNNVVQGVLSGEVAIKRWSQV